LLEFEEVYPGRLYGTLRSEVDSATAQRPVLLDIDVMGAQRVKQLFGSRALVIFVRPPSLDVLSARLRGRGTENPGDLETRLDRARTEMGFANSFDVSVTNDDLERAVEETIRAVRTFLESGPSPSGFQHGSRPE
jgi:guanylate kinase